MEDSKSRWSHWRKRKGNVGSHIDYVHSSKFALGTGTPENASPTPLTPPPPSPSWRGGGGGAPRAVASSLTRSHADHNCVGVFDFAQDSPTESEVEPAATPLSHARPLVNLDHGEQLDKLPVANTISDQESDEFFAEADGYLGCFEHFDQSFELSNDFDDFTYLLLGFRWLFQWWFWGRQWYICSSASLLLPRWYSSFNLCIGGITNSWSCSDWY